MSGVQTIGGITLTAGGIQPGGDVETLLLAICADRSNALNSVAQGQAAEMQKSNQKIAELNAALNELRSRSPSQDKAGQQLAAQGAGEQFAGQGRLTVDTFNTLAKFGINYGDYANYNQTSADPPPYGTGNDTLKVDGGWGNLMEAVKTQIDTVSSSSQLDMIKLQSTINKANQSVDMMTNLVQKFSDVKDKIVGNIR